ncbi:chorismate mutase [Parashewanella tropica]|uniref:chorismate mutase n=1 Tax=Parashewanella tropica TaxID=2547970 RepID=UPI001059B3E9|nr:chorismate mutase [Parashewanella tropica]
MINKHLLAVLLLCFSSTSVAKENPSIYSVIQSRLSLCHDVATYKIHNKIAVENKKQEEIVLSKAVKSAKQFALRPEPVIKFTQALMESCKQIQRADFNRNQSQQIEVPPLKKIREELAKHNKRLFTLLATQLQAPSQLTNLDYSTFSNTLSTLPLNKVQKRDLFETMKKIQLEK